LWSDWNKVDKAVQVFTENYLQFIPVEGNHDSDYGEHHDVFENHFSSLLDSYKKQSWYIGNYRGLRNSAYTMSLNNMDFVVISLEFNADNEAFSWANSVINEWIPRNLPESRVIILTHSYMRTVIEDNDYKLIYTSTGENFWENLIEDNPVIDFVICGHAMGDLVRQKNRTDGTVIYPENLKISSFIPGNHVYEILIDYQGDKKGGNGWYKIFKFDRPGSNLELFHHEKYPENPLEHNFIVSYPIKEG